jgi:DNA-binding MarR family transcriptional regulator
MRIDGERKKSSDNSVEDEMHLLYEIDSQPDSSQRTLAARIGIALGLTNILIRRLVEKGYVRVSKAGWKRWVYTLTPAGISHKTRLTVSYIQRFLGHYQQVRQMLREELASMDLHTESRIAVCGTGSTAEIVYLALRELEIEEIDFYEKNPEPGQRFVGMLLRNVTTLDPEAYDKVIVTQLENNYLNLEILDGIAISPGKLETLFPNSNGTGPE